ncbi:hypothetical protein ZWY2020_020315 [Hordeum vulgare]|nr:hypothetical protein ZWY2020_020315 [Hordeum vulgare]
MPPPSSLSYSTTSFTQAPSRPPRASSRPLRLELATYLVALRHLILNTTARCRAPPRLFITSERQLRRRAGVMVKTLPSPSPSTSTASMNPAQALGRAAVSSPE